MFCLVSLVCSFCPRDVSVAVDVTVAITMTIRSDKVNGKDWTITIAITIAIAMF